MYTTKPLFIFEDSTSTGINEVPEDSLFYVKITPERLYSLIDNTSLTETTTIADLVTTYSSQYKTIGSLPDVDTVYYDVAGSFTTAQRATFVTTEDNSIAFNNGNNLSFTATAANITVTNQTVGQSGTLVLASSNLITGWGTEFDWGYQGVPTDLSGTEIFGYTISAVSGVDSIKIGRV